MGWGFVKVNEAAKHFSRSQMENCSNRQKTFSSFPLVHVGAWGRGREGRRVMVQWIGGGANKITFYWPTTPEECLFVCVQDGGDKKLMHRHRGSGDWAGHCCPLQGMLPVCACVCLCMCVWVCVCVCECVSVCMCVMEICIAALFFMSSDGQNSQHKLWTFLCWLIVCWLIT